MRLSVLGSSGGYPIPGNPNSGFLLEAGGRRLWLDAGTGTFAELQRQMDPARVDAIVISHAHGDHCLDLVPLYIALRYPQWRAQVPLYCPAEVRAELAGFAPAVDAAKLDEVFGFTVVDEGDVAEVAGFRLSFARTDHPAYTLAVRVEAGGAALAYSADTGPGVDLAPFARGCDLLLCEATYQRAYMGAPVHLSAEEAAATARRAGAGGLLLTHVWPGLDPAVSLAEARAAAPGLPVEWAAPGAAFDVRHAG